MDLYESQIHQVFVKLLDGKHKVFNFGTPSISVAALKHRIESLTSIPAHLQLLISDNSRILPDHQHLTFNQSREVETLDPNRRPLHAHDDILGGNLPKKPLGFSGKFPMVVHLLLRVRGGKGGFGSLLRGAATKAGQKKTNNFDACRDMSGRRLRHVNAEKKLEEWRAEAEERKLEKMAEDFLKKKSKEAAKSGKSKGGDSAEKYVAKYREDSAKCMEAVEKSVKESIKGSMSSKRKSIPEGIGSDFKRLKIWMGKRKLGDSDSEDIDEEDIVEDESGDNEKSVVIDSRDHSSSSQEINGSSEFITVGKLDVGSLHQGSFESGSEEDVTDANGLSKSNEYVDGCSDDGKGKSCDDSVVESPVKIKQNGIDTEVPNKSSLEPGVPISVVEVNCAAESKNCVPVEKESVPQGGITVKDLDKPLNFDDYHSARELEVLGLERLKSELQACGLKCGGTLQERAARLFLLKTIPLEKLPMKLFAKK